MARADLRKRGKRNARQGAIARANSGKSLTETAAGGTSSSSTTTRRQNVLLGLSAVLMVGMAILALANAAVESKQMRSLQHPDNDVLDDGGEEEENKAEDSEFAAVPPTRSSFFKANSAGAIHVDGFLIPSNLSGSMDTYPNPVGITEEERKAFHPVVRIPTKKVELMADPEGGDEKDAKKKKKKVAKVPDTKVMDFVDSSGLAPLGQWGPFQKEDGSSPDPRPRPKGKKEPTLWLGKYDEDRKNMYVSDMFQDVSNQIDGYAGSRTVHIGMDIGGSVGTKVHAFTNGIIHSVGYNPERGDYGNVIVVEHHLEVEKKKNNEDDATTKEQRKIWALYGHLDGKSVRGKKAGQKVRRGQVLGRFGDVHENGGWIAPHVHFQISTKPPQTHDMPGAVTMEDRPRALIDYPDPRLVLGELY